LIIRRRAEEDLAGIFLYTIENWGLEQAIKYRDLVFAAIEGLRISPKRGVPVPEAPRLHSRKAGGHRIYYVFDRHELQIIRVLHERMDAPRHFPGLA
jgi:toxin ParE1/3/4